MAIQIFTDGASRGNPGESGCGAILFRDGKEIQKISIYLGKKTNNEAEYLAVISALKYIQENELQNENILVFSDSEFLVKQLKGEYAVKSLKVKPLFEEVKKIIKDFEINFNWIPRKDNEIADKLANLAIDNFQETQKGDKKSRPSPLLSPTPILLLDRAFFGKINCLKIQLNNQKECYFHLGLEKNKEWIWQKVKMSSIEMGDIIFILKNEGKCSFFHAYDNQKTQIWCNKSEKGFSIKIGDISKNLTIGESEVLRIILERIIILKEFN